MYRSVYQRFFLYFNKMVICFVFLSTPHCKTPLSSINTSRKWLQEGVSLLKRNTFDNKFLIFIRVFRLMTNFVFNNSIKNKRYFVIFLKKILYNLLYCSVLYNFATSKVFLLRRETPFFYFSRRLSSWKKIWRRVLQTLVLKRVAFLYRHKETLEIQTVTRIGMS